MTYHYSPACFYSASEDQLGKVHDALEHASHDALSYVENWINDNWHPASGSGGCAVDWFIQWLYMSEQQSGR